MRNLFLSLTVVSAAAVLAGSAWAAQPDVSGIWGGQIVAGGSSIVDQCNTHVDAFNRQDVSRLSYQGRSGSQLWVTFEQDCGVIHRGKLNKPLYKPQYWQSVRLHDYYGDTGGVWDDYTDPEWKGVALDGVPRMGPPNKIMQSSNEVAFFYQTGNLFRVIPTDCRQWDPVEQYDQTPMGLAVGCFLDDGTLVIKSTGFSSDTWLDWSGYIHSDQMVVTETFKRVADNLLYNVMVEDPIYLVQPWNMGQQTLALQKDPTAQLIQDVPYVNRTLGNLVDPQYRG